MARRKKSSPAEDLIQLAVMLPWWAGVVLAVLSCLLLHQAAAQSLTTSAQPGQVSAMVVGREYGVVPYGIEALMIMRTEKGFLHVGGDTDGTTLPGDVGMDRGIARKAANFVGQRSLLRPAAQDADRMQLVGLLPRDRRTRLPVGAHVAASKPPAPIEGFVTSSHHSPVLGHPVALCMLARGQSRIGDTLMVWHLGNSIEAEVVNTPFYDPSGERVNGFA